MLLALTHRLGGKSHNTNIKTVFKPALQWDSALFWRVDLKLAPATAAAAGIMTTNNTDSKNNGNITTITNSESNNKLKQDNADLIEKCKANAARLAVDDNINSDCIVGIGSGSTMRYVLERIKQRCQDQNFLVKCIPTSFQAKQLIYDYSMPLAEIEANPVIDVTIDGADEMDQNFVAIKGGGACLAQEKVIAFAANKFVVVADYRKNSKHLGDNWKKGIPIEVLPMACQAVRHYVARRFDADLEDLPLRIGREKAGPVITDNGNFVIDWRFNRVEHHKFTASAWAQLANQLKAVPGVVETGIFANMIKAAYFGLADGTVLKKIPQSDTDEQDDTNTDE